jgi:hypothetical protein
MVLVVLKAILVSVSEYFGSSLCSMSKVCECDPFGLFVCISFGVTLVRHGVVFVKCLFYGLVYLVLVLL